MSGEPRGFEIRFFGIMAIILACVVLMYGTTFRGDLEVTIVLLTATMFLVIGLTFGVLMTGIRLKFFDIRILETVLLTGTAFGAIYVVNRLVPIQFAVTAPISQRWLGVLVGVAEECFFRIFLCGVGSHFSKWGAIIGSSAIWSPYHIARYGGDPNRLFLIFLVGLYLGWQYLITRCADGVIFAHALVNYQAIR